MVELGDEDVSDADRLAADADQRREAWGATLDDMTAMADELEADGWETVRIAAGDSGPFGPSSQKGDSEAFGLAYVIPGDKAQEVSDLFEQASFSEYEIYRAENNGLVYMVTALFAPEIQTAILVAGAWEMRHALECAMTAMDEGLMYTFLQKLDGTVVGVVEHDDPEKFFPNVEAIKSYAPNADEFDDSNAQTDEA
ncbi:hypothetical protein ACFQJC_16105 [Haloferax namakaokahaiae]|uniref:Uncharacterized protein n=1 Tax=Haloferax namakaokahaiae TaxID=1748331 RepID=A0ABD5ZIX8_9EURY